MRQKHDGIQHMNPTDTGKNQDLHPSTDMGQRLDSTPSSDADQRPDFPTFPIAIYNQAYQENYKADTIPYIIKHANNAYVLIDPFEEDTSQYVTQLKSQIAQMKSKGNQVGGYISAGTGEDWRSDFKALKPYLTTKVWPQWKGEFFVSETTTGVLDVMKKRIDKMADRGVDWVEFDNMDWLDKDTKKKFKLKATVAEVKAYINALCDHTHARAMKCMAKNTVEGFESFDGVLYESYHNEKDWWEADGTRLFLNTNKLVIINHYKESDCDASYREYKKLYQSEKISYICEDRQIKKYVHYNE